jgi:hypothetical protein
MNSIPNSYYNYCVDEGHHIINTFGTISSTSTVQYNNKNGFTIADDQLRVENQIQPLIKTEQSSKVLLDNQLFSLSSSSTTSSSSTSKSKSSLQYTVTTSSTMMQRNYSITSFQQCCDSYTNSSPGKTAVTATATTTTTTTMCRNNSRIVSDSLCNLHDTNERIHDNNKNSITFTSKLQSQNDTITKSDLEKSVPIDNTITVDNHSNIMTSVPITSKQEQCQEILLTDDVDADTIDVVLVESVMSSNTVSIELQKQNNKMKVKKSVSFSNDISFQEYSLIVYEHPYNKDKLALSLDWDHTESYVLPLEIIGKDRCMKYYPPTRLSYSQRRQRLQQVSPDNYRYWRDVILLGGSGSSTNSISNSSTDSLQSIDADGTTIASETSLSLASSTRRSDTGSVLSNNTSVKSNNETTTVVNTNTDLSSIISRLSQPSLNSPSMFLTLSNLSDSDSDIDDDEATNHNDTITEKFYDTKEDTNINDDDFISDQLETNSTTGSTVILSMNTGRASPTEQSIGLLSEGDDNDYHLYSRGKDNMYSFDTRQVSSNLDYHHHRQCRHEQILI